MQTTASVAVRELPSAEWSRLLNFEPFASAGLPNADYWRVVVAEDEGQIVGFTCMYTAVHFEPIWIDPHHQHQPGLFRDLWQASKAILAEHDVQMIFTVVPDVLPAQQALVERFGFVAAPGQLYIGHVEQIGV